jgi:hypothetical protein
MSATVRNFARIETEKAADWQPFLYLSAEEALVWAIATARERTGSSLPLLR